MTRQIQGIAKTHLPARPWVFIFALKAPKEATTYCENQSANASRGKGRIEHCVLLARTKATDPTPQIGDAPKSCADVRGALPRRVWVNWPRIEVCTNGCYRRQSERNAAFWV